MSSKVFVFLREMALDGRDLGQRGHKIGEMKDGEIFEFDE